MTEDEARTRWCPMARVVEVGDGELHGPFNRYHTSNVCRPIDEQQARCIASECMAWRAMPDVTLSVPDVVRRETGIGWVEWIKQYREKTGADLADARREMERQFGGRAAVPSGRGYCGAFGRPEE